jgi:hypothetical protein
MAGSAKMEPQVFEGDSSRGHSVWIGSFDTYRAQAPQLSRAQITKTLAAAYERYSRSGETPVRSFAVRMCMEVDFDALLLGKAHRYGWEEMGSSSRPPKSVTLRGVKVTQRLIRQANFARSTLDEVAQRVSGAGRAQWPQRFNEELFGLPTRRVLGLAVGPGSFREVHDVH